MAQDTWALKLDTELKEKLQEIIRNDFESSKDFMEQVVNMYQLNQLKQGENVLSSEVEELESLTRRINNIFINANGKINTMLQDKDIKAEQQTELKQKLIERLQGDLNKLEQEKNGISSINDELVNLNNEYKQEVNQLTKSNSTLNDLVVEYKEKNDTLTGLLQEYKQDREENKALEKANKELLAKINQVQLDAAKQASESEELRAKLQEQENKHQDELQEIINKHSDELVNMKRSAEIERNMYVLELQSEHQTKLHQIQNKHIDEIEKYQAKYRELLEQMQQVKESNANVKQQSKVQVNNSEKGNR